MSMKHVALIGAGSVVRGKHVEGYRKYADRMRPYLLCDPSAESRELTGDFYHIPQERRLKSLDELAAFQSEIDFAVVSSPHRFHGQCTRAAFEQSWPVLTEKPGAWTVRELEELIAESQAKKLLFGITHNVHYSTIIGSCEHAVREERALGSVMLIRAESYHNPVRPGTWFTDPEVGGYGHFYDCMYHEVYHALSLIDAPPIRVSAHAGVLRDGAPAPHWREGIQSDSMLATVHFANGAAAIFQDVDAFGARGGRTVFEVHGSGGSLLRSEFPPDFPLGMIVDHNNLRRPVGLHAGTSDHGFESLFKGWLDALDGLAALPYGISASGEGLAVLKVVLGAYESAKTGKTVIL